MATKYAPGDKVCSDPTGVWFLLISNLFEQNFYGRFNNFQIKLIAGPAEGDISHYEENPTFMLEDFYVTYHDYKDACCEHEMSTVTYHVQIQRRTRTSVYNYIVPCVVINIIGNVRLIYTIAFYSGS